MEAAKKTYHMACKEEKLAVTREANGKTEASVTPDQQKKLHEKVDKCKQDVQKVRRGSGMLTDRSSGSKRQDCKQNALPDASEAKVFEVKHLLSCFSSCIPCSVCSELVFLHVTR